MRTRQEIEQTRSYFASDNKYDPDNLETYRTAVTSLQLEVLLDIRDLLTKEKL